MNFNLQGDGVSAALELRKTFFKWQCRVRQLAVREHAGRPDPSIMPLIRLGPNLEEIGYIITLIHKLPRFSVTSELRHIAKKTFDPLQRRDQAIRFLSATYYQKADEFADLFTATFDPNSKGAIKMLEDGLCNAVFEAYSQRFELNCKIWKLVENNPYYQSTFAHNLLFNPDLKPDTLVLGFEPNWRECLSSNSVI